MKQGKDPYVRAMEAAMRNMLKADEMRAAGDWRGASQLADATMQIAMMLSAQEALFQAIHGKKNDPSPD